jgi:hypothetical protein
MTLALTLYGIPALIFGSGYWAARPNHPVELLAASVVWPLCILALLGFKSGIAQAGVKA